MKSAMSAAQHIQSLTCEEQLSLDVAVIRAAMGEIDEGKGQEAGAFFDSLRLRLLAMKGGTAGSAE
jgi:hypothetical protein